MSNLQMEGLSQNSQEGLGRPVLKLEQGYRVVAFVLQFGEEGV